MSKKDHMCDGNCRYRSLYEGAQSSLSDLASKQAGALGRVGRLRNGLINTLKQKYPKKFTLAEQNAGCRFNQMDDEYVLGYFEQIIETSSELKISTLRSALVELGVNLPETDNIEQWSTAIKNFKIDINEKFTLNNGKEITENSNLSGAANDLIKIFDTKSDSSKPLVDLIRKEDFKEVGIRNSNVSNDSNASNELPDDDLSIPPLASWLTSVLEIETYNGDSKEGSNLDSLFEEPVAKKSENELFNPITSFNQNQSTATQMPINTIIVKPELFPIKKSKTNKRKSGKALKTTATPPDLPQGEQPDVVLTDSIREKIMSAVCIPRPVFTSDLITIAGSELQVGLWESECLEHKDQEVRFVNPKKRHAQRGSLVLPHGFLRVAATEFTKSPWGECMQRYRSTVLYELGIFISHRGSEIITHNFNEELAVFRLNQSRGIIGIIFSLSEKINDKVVTQIGEEVEKMFNEKLTLLIVLTPYAENLDLLVKNLTTFSTVRRWKPSMPIVAARSWEYALDKGSSAILISGA